MTTALDALTSLELALNDLGAALMTGRPDAVLSAEIPLGAAVQRLSQLRESGAPLSGDPAEWRRLAKSVRIAVLKCQALGAASDTLCRLMIPGAAYGHKGRRPSSVLHSTLDSRV